MPSSGAPGGKTVRQMRSRCAWSGNGKWTTKRRRRWNDGSSAAYTGELEEEDFRAARARQGIGEVGVRETRWDMTGADFTIHGKLQPGPAVGLALAISEKRDGTKPVTWWTDQITLVPEGETSA